MFDNLNEIIIPTSLFYIANGMAWFNGVGLGDLREPGKLGITPLLIETGYHDNPAEAQWIIDNTTPIAQAITDSITQFYSLPMRE